MKHQIYKGKYRFFILVIGILSILGNTMYPTLPVLAYSAKTTIPYNITMLDEATTSEPASTEEASTLMPEVTQNAYSSEPTATEDIMTAEPAATEDTVSAEPAATEDTATTKPVATEDSMTVEPTATEDVTPPIETEKATLKMLFTTDLHGSLTTTDYETGETIRSGTLARCITKIKEERSKVSEKNSFLFDVGDTLYNYTTDYIYEYNSTYIQPIHRAIKNLGYDAVTLGNHEFDYGFPYIKNQIEESGLEDICVVSNVFDANTGQNVWKENMIINKEIQTTSGTSIIKVGIIGETIPKLSSKRTSYKGILTTEDIVTNATTQAKKLKEQGADIIVALSHSGIGEENPAPKADNAAYALTKIDEIDVVLCGHLHKDFPSSSPNSASYYNLPGIDKDTGLANGKNLIMATALGTSIGVADLSLEKINGSWEITDRKSAIRKITSNIEPAEHVDNDYMESIEPIMISNYSTILGEIEKGESYQTYFSMLEDSAAIQIVNDAKLQHGLNYIKTENTAYKDYPVIAASVFEKYGQSDAFDYADISGNFLKSYLSQIEHYRTGLGIYKITGKQLKEWINLVASAYETIDTTSSSPQTLIKDEWANNGRFFYVFDGVEYTIDPSKEPRYDIKGNIISDSDRITSLTINGNPVNNTDKLLVVCDSDIAFKSVSILNTINSQKLTATLSDRSQTFIKNYIEACALEGTLKQIQDYNWHLQLPTNKKYLIASGNNSKTVANTKEWLTWKKEEDDYQFYELDASKMSNLDTTGPKIIATPLNTKVTGKSVTVAVQVNDLSGVSSIRYMAGKYSVNSKAWQYSSELKNNAFTCSENGVYSILATDSHDNKSIYYVRITNINKNMIATPNVDNYTNRKLKVTGTAEASATVYVELQNGKKYSCKADSKGVFSCSVTPQKSGSSIYVYAVKSGKTSARAEIFVNRTGPNKPILNQVHSNKNKITGTLNDNYCTPILIVGGKTVYVPKNGGLNQYKNSDLYSPGYAVREVDYSLSSNGNFTMTLPRLISGDTEVILYTIDTLYRNSLSSRTTSIQELPNRPVLLTSTIYNSTTSLKAETDEYCKVYANINGSVYVSEEITYNPTNLKYSHIITIPRTKAKTTVTIYAKNKKGNSSRLSYTVKERIPEPPIIKSAKENAKKITGTVHLIGADCKTTTVSASQTKVYVKVNKKTYKAKITSSGAFYVKVKKLKKGDTITIWATNINGTGRKYTKKI